VRQSASVSALAISGARLYICAGHFASNHMNRLERLFGLKGEARIRYMAGEYQVLSPGDFVVCAVTGKPIPLPDLRYWSVELQEPYASAEASLQRFLELRRKASGSG
jgi:hypothetical protein